MLGLFPGEKSLSVSTVLCLGNVSKNDDNTKQTDQKYPHIQAVVPTCVLLILGSDTGLFRC